MLIQNQIVKKPQSIVITNRTSNSVRAPKSNDSFCCENTFINKKPFVDKKIIKENENINSFFDNISSKIFHNSSASHSLSKLLQMGYISFSSSTYSNLNDPKSAIGIKLNPQKTPSQNCAILEHQIRNGVGVGFNLSDFKDTISQIEKINNYFKYREPNLNRPPAGIALLNINHPKILNFISLKDNADYKNWCFDLSVVIDDDFLRKVDNNEPLTLSDNTQISAKQVYLKLLDSMLKSGEPGIIFSNDKDFICDSCAASQLNENEGLNLAHINLSKFYNPKTKSMDLDFLSQSSNVLSQALKKIAPNGFIGVLGYQDLLNKAGINYGSKEAIKILETCLETIKKQANANDIRMAISPTGTISRILKTTYRFLPKCNILGRNRYNGSSAKISRWRDFKNYNS